MTLLEILVQELPKRGGWPDGATKITQDYDKEACGWLGDDLSSARSLGRLKDLADNHRLHSTDECQECFVYFDQYEAALAAAQQPVWNGEGLPPVGCECEMQDAVGEFIPVDIIANHDGFAFGWNYDRHAAYFSDKRCEFRPLNSEADKKREAAIESLMRIVCSPSQASATVNKLYDAIAAGKIPGVKLED